MIEGHIKETPEGNIGLLADELCKEFGTPFRTVSFEFKHYHKERVASNPAGDVHFAYRKQETPGGYTESFTVTKCAGDQQEIFSINVQADGTIDLIYAFSNPDLLRKTMDLDQATEKWAANSNFLLGLLDRRKLEFGGNLSMHYAIEKKEYSLRDLAKFFIGRFMAPGYAMQQTGHGAQTPQYLTVP